MTTNTEPPADVKRLIQKAKFEVAALHNEGRPELAQFIARMGEALLSAQPAPSQSGLVAWYAEVWTYISDGNFHWMPVVSIDKPEIGTMEKIRNLTPLYRRTNNQPAPDDGLVGELRTAIADFSKALLGDGIRSCSTEDAQNRILNLVMRHQDTILSALTAKDHTALLSDCKPLIAEMRDELFSFSRKRERCTEVLARIDQALATKGDGE